MDNRNGSELFGSLDDALEYMNFASGLSIDEELYRTRLRTKWSSIISILPLSLGFIGLIFNILAVLLFKSSKTFRQNSFRWYIYALALINCASILTHSWLYLAFYLANDVYLCTYLRYLQQATATTSLWIMVLLSFERSFTFSQPFVVKRFLQSHTICFILAFVTVLCFAVHVDELVFVEVKAFRWVNFAFGICSIRRNSFLARERLKIVIHLHSFILPFLLNSILDIYICYKMCQRRKRLAIKSSLKIIYNTHKKAFRRTKRSVAHEITVTLLCQSMWLLFTYFPTHLYYFLMSFNLINGYDRDNSTLTFLMRQNLLVYLAFSPTLYVILSSTLRREIRMYICRSYKRHRSGSLSNLSSAQNKFRHFFDDFYRPDRPGQQKNLTIIVTTSEQIQRKFLSPKIFVPFKIHYLSRSAPCLIMCENKDDDQLIQKFERSNTLFQ